MTPTELQQAINSLIRECATRDVALPMMKLALLIIKEQDQINRALGAMGKAPTSTKGATSKRKDNR